MFYAMAENKIDLRGYRFEHRLEDIQTLNERATRGELHISAISIHAYAYVARQVRPAALRREHGGRLWTDGGQETSIREGKIRASQIGARFLGDKTIAVPGRMTSAFLALQLYLGEFKHIVVPFDHIFEAMKSGRAEAGLIIHEGQLTYAASGFEKVLDLGEWWKSETGLPLPLGGNVIRKDIPRAVQRDLIQILRESVDYALAHREPAVQHSMPYARDMDAELAGKFIGMYVNDFTRDYGENGRAAIRRFLGDAARAGYIENSVELEFAS